MKRRLAIEGAFALAGLAVTYAIGWASAWSYPLGSRDIWLVTWVSMAAVAVLNARQIQRAVAEERQKEAMRDG